MLYDKSRKLFLSMGRSHGSLGGNWSFTDRENIVHHGINAVTFKSLGTKINTIILNIKYPYIYFMIVSASLEFRKALKMLRQKFNLTQNQIAGIANITQADYSDYEIGKKKLDLDSANNLSKEVWGTPYTDFVAFSKKEIDIDKLPPSTAKIIRESENKKLRDTSNLLATELDRLISEGHFNSPTTSKIVHLKMDNKLTNRKTSEITSLLGRAPRNKQIIFVGKYGAQKIYIHQDHSGKYEKMTNEELGALIAKQENKGTNDKES